MDYKDKAELVELKKLITKMQEDISNLYELYNQIINQNTLQSQQNLAQGQENGANAQSRIYSQHDGQTISPADLRQFSFNSQQNSSSHRRDDERNSPLRSLLASTDSPRTPNERGISDSGERNFAESRSTAKSAESGTRIANEQEISRRSGAQSRESGAISQTSKDTEAIYRKSLECTELEKAEFNRLFLAFLKLNKEIETNLEKKYNDNIDKIIKEHNAKRQYVYATQLGHFTQETMKKIKKEVFFLKSYGYEISPQNTKAIKNLLELGQDKAMKM